MRLLREIVVPAREARWLAVPAGAVLGVVDLEGRQVGDLMAPWRDDPTEYLSPGTPARVWPAGAGGGRRALLRPPPPLMRILRDDVGRHDLSSPAATPSATRSDYGAAGHPSCLESLQSALARPGSRCRARRARGNVFMNNRHEGGRMLEPTSPSMVPGRRSSSRRWSTSSSPSPPVPRTSAPATPSTRRRWHSASEGALTMAPARGSRSRRRRACSPAPGSSRLRPCLRALTVAASCSPRRLRSAPRAAGAVHEVDAAGCAGGRDRAARSRHPCTPRLRRAADVGAICRTHSPPRWPGAPAGRPAAAARPRRSPAA